MDAGKDASASPRVWAALAGFEAGMFGVAVMLLAVGLASAWYRRGFWGPANIMASLFYGDDAIGRAFSWSTVSGLAVYLILYSLFGALYGAVIYGSGWTRLRITLIGILAGVAWYTFWFALVWKHVNPLIPLYTHDRPMFWGHMLYGAMLGRFPLYYARLVPPPVRQPAPVPAPEPAPTPQESPSLPDSNAG